MKKYLIAIIALVTLNCNAQNKTSLSPTEFDAGIKNESSQLLDVRTTEEYNSGHINNALWADWNNETEFLRRTNFLDKQKPLYVYCLSGGRSAAAAKSFRSKGFVNVYELKGGINAWKNDNKQVVGKSLKPQMTEATFDDIIIKNKIVLVDFGAEWCPPCRQMKPIIIDLQSENKNKFTLLNVDAGNDEILVKKYKATSLPVFIIYKNGIETWRKNGIVSKEELITHLEIK